MRRSATESRADSKPATRGEKMLREFFASRSWTPFEFQVQTWKAFADGRSGLIHVPTGAGKTWAAFGGPLADLIDSSGARPEPVLRALYLTPLRAVSRDIELALREPVEALGLPFTVESRTGDTPQRVRLRQRERLPHILVTTPESLTLLLTRENSAELFAHLRAVIVDEWHELLSSKRGTQTELALARLRRFSPRARTWALSATLHNVEEAARAVVGVKEGAAPCIISAGIDRPVVIEALLPSKVEAFPWAGHSGLSMLPALAEALNPGVSTLVFTNTRSQAERWYQGLLALRPSWAGIAALHHGSIDRAERERVERGLKSGGVRLVVATSSLDLGVDFAPVERVVQIGSVKGIARLLQRAGRSGHRPGATCRVLCVPTNGLELLEIDAARAAAQAGRLEPRSPLRKPLDVLVQHMVSIALGGGFDADELFSEVRTAYAYRDLTREEFDWVLALAREGGATLRAYPDFHRIRPLDGEPRRYGPASDRLSRLHRLNVGTICSDETLDLRYLSGRRLGSIEENFVALLRPGDCFVSAGKSLRFVGLHDLTAFVRPARRKSTLTPIWSGTRLPISESLGEAVRHALALCAAGDESTPERRAARPIAEAQRLLSHIPSESELLAEISDTREGRHLFLFPFEGRLVHGGLAALLAVRLGRLRRGTFALAANDYGLELLADEEYPFAELISGGLFGADGLAEDVAQSVEMSALSRLQFREIARVSGLVLQTYPGARKSAGQLQSSSGLIFDVFREFDPGNLLLEQARREVMERQFEESRFVRALRRLSDATLVVRRPRSLTPLAFPLVVERMAGRVSSETLEERVEKMRRALEADLTPTVPRRRPSSKAASRSK